MNTYANRVFQAVYESYPSTSIAIAWYIWTVCLQTTSPIRKR